MSKWAMNCSGIFFNGGLVPADGYIDLDENLPGLGLSANEEKLKDFTVVE